MSSGSSFRRCLGSKGNAALLAALAERQRQALSSLEQEQVRARSTPRGWQATGTQLVLLPSWLGT